jgi:hypothetical protein
VIHACGNSSPRRTRYHCPNCALVVDRLKALILKALILKALIIVCAYGRLQHVVAPLTRDSGPALCRKGSSTFLSSFRATW